MCQTSRQLHLRDTKLGYNLFLVVYSYCHAIWWQFTGTIQSDVNCRSKWLLHDNTFAYGRSTHPAAYTLLECQKSCEFDPRCVAVDWKSSTRECRLHTNPNHIHIGLIYAHSKHYDLVSRCNITPGQCFDSDTLTSSPI